MERRHERFKATRGLCVRFSSNDAPNVTRLAEIIDVSMGGLAISYRSRRNNTEGLTRLTILTGNDLTLPCQGVYDGERTWEGHDSISPVRRCGVKFANLSKGQIRQLENFIRDYTYAPPLHP